MVERPTPEMVKRALEEATIVAVVREREAVRARAIVEALVDSGIRALEITSSTPGYAEILRDLVRRGVSERVVLGAGTIRTLAHVDVAHEAGARFFVSPHFDRDIVGRINSLGAISIPGALTPTEIHNAHAAGASFVKVFPISAVGGARYLKLIFGPLPDVRLWVSGSVALDEVTDFVEAGAALVGLTSALTAGLSVDIAPAIRDRVERAHAAVEAARRGRVLLTIAGAAAVVSASIHDLRALPEDEHVALETVIEGRRGQAVRVRRLLQRAGIDAESTLKISADGGAFTREVSAAALFDGGVLHWATDGQPLDRRAGGPLRLYIAAGASGCDNVKSVSRIEVVSK